MKSIDTFVLAISNVSLNKMKPRNSLSPKLPFGFVFAEQGILAHDSGFAITNAQTKNKREENYRCSLEDDEPWVRLSTLSNSTRENGWRLMSWIKGNKSKWIQATKIPICYLLNNNVEEQDIKNSSLSASAAVCCSFINFLALSHSIALSYSYVTLKHLH